VHVPEGRAHGSIAYGKKTKMSGDRDRVSEHGVANWFCFKVVMPDAIRYPEEAMEPVIWR